MPPASRTRVVALRLGDLVERVLHGQVRVPRVDGCVDWDERHLRRFLDDAVRGYPIGDLLVWQHPAPAGVATVGSFRLDVPAVPDAWWVIDGRRRMQVLVAVLTEQSQPADLVSEQQRAALRDYEIPLYVVTGPEESLREMRRNLDGDSAIFDEIRAVLGGPPITVDSLAATVRLLGFGQIPGILLAQSVLAVRDARFPTAGLPDRGSASRTVAEEADTAPPAVFAAVAEALPIAVSFLRDRAGVPRIELLPDDDVLPILVRFAALFGPPDPYSAELLDRWIWRGARAISFGSFVDYREAVRAEPGASARRLLGLLPDRDREWSPDLSTFDTIGQRVNLLAMLAAGPRVIVPSEHRAAGDRVDVTHLLDSERWPLADIVPQPAEGQTLANQVVHPPARTGEILTALTSRSVAAQVLASHHVDGYDVDLLRNERFDEFVNRRGSRLAREITRFVEQRAKWSFRDRPVGPLFDDEELADVG